MMFQTEVYKREGHRFLCFSMLHLCLSFLKFRLVYFIFCIANFCEVVCLGILYPIFVTLV